jgi:class 3 adenylate cyclase
MSRVTVTPETFYADSSNGRIAYQVVGDGPVDVIVSHPPFFPIDLMWDEPNLVRFLDRMSTFSRHIWLDPRGRGASEPLPPSEARLAESIVEDMTAVLDHAGCERAAVLAFGSGAMPLFAASHPERTTALVLMNSSVRTLRADDYPDGLSVDALDEMLTAVHLQWGSGTVDLLAPSMGDDARFRRWWGRSQRLTSSAATAHSRLRAVLEADLRHTLPAIKVPTLVLNGRAVFPPVSHGRYIAEHIEGARFVELEGDDFLFFVGDTDPLLDAIEEFLTGELPVHDTDRVLATVLFTDIVGSTERASAIGDRRWRETLDAYDELAGRELDRHRGKQIKTTGDGTLATFDGPARAIRCARAIRDAVKDLGLELRSGLHTGEIELRGDDVSGIAVVIGQRVSAIAGAGEVIVSSTVKDLVAGSGISFRDHSERELKGVPGSWRLFAVAD